MPDFLLTLSCIDRKGIVGAVGTTIAAQDCNILESAQYFDRATGRFFMRVHFRGGEGMTVERFGEGFAPTRLAYSMDAEIVDPAKRPRVLIMASKTGHCLNDLLHRWRIGGLAMDLVGVVSNHEDWRGRVEGEGVRYHHMPISADTKEVQEAALLSLIETENIDLVILARYMQVLSDNVARRLEGRVINIHHSFLPSFKGAKP